MRFEEATKQFLACCELERSFSPCKISAYASDLRQWRRFLAKALPASTPRITDVNRHLVRRFIVHQREAGLSNATVVRRVNTYLTDEEMRRLLSAAGQTHYANLAARDQAVIGMFLFAGVRRQDLTNVHVRDINWEDGIIRVRHGKGGRIRAIPMVRELRELLEAWLVERPRLSAAALSARRRPPRRRCRGARAHSGASSRLSGRCWPTKRG